MTIGAALASVSVWRVRMRPLRGCIQHCAAYALGGWILQRMGNCVRNRIGVIKAWGNSSYMLLPQVIESYTTALPYGAIPGAIIGALHSCWIVAKQAHA